VSAAIPLKPASSNADSTKGMVERESTEGNLEKDSRVEESLGILSARVS
jgi:hypothetical protein